MTPTDKLMEYFTKFPGIGPRQAKRFVYFILRKSVLGKFWAALIIGIIGSVIGVFLLDDILKNLPMYIM